MTTASPPRLPARENRAAGPKEPHPFADRRRHRRHLHRHRGPRRARAAWSSPRSPARRRISSRASRRRPARAGARRRPAGRRRALHPRHHRRHQRRPRAEGRGDRRPDHRGLRGRARARAAEALADVRPRHGPGDADVPGAAAPARGHPRAARRARPRPRAARRGRGARRGAALRAQGVQAIAVCYLFSFVNPRPRAAHARDRREVAPEISVSLSSEVDPTFREYERLCVTAFDAYLGPVVKRYLAGLAETLRGLGRRRRAADHALARRHRLGGAGRAAAGHALPLRPGGGRDRRQLRRPSARACATSSRSTWAAPATTSRSCATAAAARHRGLRSAPIRCARRWST